MSIPETCYTIISWDLFALPGRGDIGARYANVALDDAHNNQIFIEWIADCKLAARIPQPVSVRGGAEGRGGARPNLLRQLWRVWP